jgi:hypothetical protein
MGDKKEKHPFDDILDTPEGESFLESVQRVKADVTNPGQRNRRGCRFPHCSCNNPWEACDRCD